MNPESRARQADHELSITEQSHAEFRADCIEKAILLAKAGESEKAYRKLLMVVAIDGVRAMVLMQKTDAEIDKGVEDTRSGQPN